MSEEPALFLWDIDGTILRAGTGVHRAAFTHAFRTVYGRDLSLDGIRPAGRTDRWLLAEPLRRDGVSDEEILARMPEAFRLMGEYAETYLEDLRDRVLPGVRETLSLLHERGYLQGLLTGNLERIAHAKMRAAGLSGYFDTGGFGEESATRADLVPVALSNAGARAGRAIPANRAVIIGDTGLDVEAGLAHGTRTVAVATGPFSADELASSGADLVLSSFEDVEDAVRRLEALVR